MRSVREFGAPQQISTGFASWFRYCSDVAHLKPTKLYMIFRCLLGWHIICTFLGALAPNGILPAAIKYTRCDQVLRSPVLAALLHGTRVSAVSQTLWRGTRNGITELSQREPPIFGWAAITLGIGPHSSYFCSW